MANNTFDALANLKRLQAMAKPTPAPVVKPTIAKTSFGGYGSKQAQQDALQKAIDESQKNYTGAWIKAISKSVIIPEPKTLTKPLNPSSSTYGVDYKNYINSLTKYDSLRIVAGVQERPTDTLNTYIQKSTGVETEQCATCNLDIFLAERGYTVNDLNRPTNDSFWNIFNPTKYNDLRELVREREILINAGVKGTELDLRSAESINAFKEKLPIYKEELQKKTMLENQIDSGSYSSSIQDMTKAANPALPAIQKAMEIQTANKQVVSVDAEKPEKKGGLVVLAIAAAFMI